VRMARSAIVLSAGRVPDISDSASGRPPFAFDWPGARRYDTTRFAAVSDVSLYHGRAKERGLKTYDVAVLGGGPGGYVAALRAAARGAAACCIEAGQLGGVCLNLGCIPTKAMLHASEIFHSLGRAPEYGLDTGTRAVDGGAFMKRASLVAAGLRKGVEGLLAARKVDVIRGRGALTAPDTIRVDAGGKTRDVKAASIVLATGARPARPDFLPWTSDRLWTSDEATTAGTLPESVVVMGGGVIGCEFATVYSELGIPTTLVEMLDRLVPNFDADASKAVTRGLKKRGVAIHTGTRVVAMKAAKKGVTAELEGGTTVKAAVALIVVGRVPNVEEIGLETVGVELDGGIIKVDDRCRTNVAGIYAVGDCATVLQYAHLASRMGIVAADNATGHETRDPRDVVPTVVYTHPEVASVGLTEAQARDTGKDIRVARFPYQASGMARAYGDAEGEVKLIAETGCGEILGAMVIGRHAADVVQELALAIRNELTVEELAATIHPHPTFGEAVGEAAEAWMGLPIHTAG